MIVGRRDQHEMEQLVSAVYRTPSPLHPLRVPPSRDAIAALLSLAAEQAPRGASPPQVVPAAREGRIDARACDEHSPVWHLNAGVV